MRPRIIYIARLNPPSDPVLCLVEQQNREKSKTTEKSTLLQGTPSPPRTCVVENFLYFSVIRKKAQNRQNPRKKIL